MAKPADKLIRTSEYIRMRDGVRLAVDTMRPVCSNSVSLPTLVIISRYWRSFRFRGVGQPPGRAFIGPRAPMADAFLERGFNVVVADSRGTGASEGVWRYPWAPEQLEDHCEVVDWIVTQEWSNGDVVAAGISYEASTAVLLAASGHPAVKAVSARSFEYDVYTDVAFPGGVFNEFFIRTWSEGGEELDRNRFPVMFGKVARLFISGVRPVDDDSRGQSLKSIVESRSNPNVFDSIRSAEFRRDRYGDQNVSIGDMGVGAHIEALRASGVPLRIIGSWRDGATAVTALRLFETLPNVREIHIDALSHSGEHHASPFREGGKPEPTLKTQWDETIRYFERECDEESNVAEHPPQIHYFMMGEEKWRTTAQWPPAGVRTQELFVCNGGTLAPTQPSAADTSVYRVDPKASTGRGNRWYTELARPVRYGNRRRADQRTIHWTGDALAQDIEIVGHPKARLFISLNQPDAAFFVYLEFVSRDGSVHYITDGVLRAIHAGAHPTPTYCRENTSEWTPGEIHEVSIRMYPTAIRVPAGSRIRLALAGADADTFAAISTDSDLTFTVHHGPETPTHIELPVLNGTV